MTEAQQVLRDLLLDGDLTRAQVEEVLDEALPAPTIMEMLRKLQETHPDPQVRAAGQLAYVEVSHQGWRLMRRGRPVVRRDARYLEHPTSTLLEFEIWVPAPEGPALCSALDFAFHTRSPVTVSADAEPLRHPLPKLRI